VIGRQFVEESILLKNLVALSFAQHTTGEGGRRHDRGRAIAAMIKIASCTLIW
jgi:hypothetical protein